MRRAQFIRAGGLVLGLCILTYIANRGYLDPGTRVTPRAEQIIPSPGEPSPVYEPLLIYHGAGKAGAGNSPAANLVGWSTSEQSICISMANPNIVFLGANKAVWDEEDGKDINADSHTDVFLSQDGGLTWAPAAEGEPVFANNWTDPAVAIRESDGLLMLATVRYATNGITRGDLALLTSDDLGASWADATIATPVNSLPSVLYEVPDKPHFTVDNSPTSPNVGRMYCGWKPAWGGDALDSTQFEAVVSSWPDSAGGWSEPSTVSAEFAEPQHDGINLATDREGNAYAVWAITPTRAVVDEIAIGFARSPAAAAGLYWDPPLKIASGIRGSQGTIIRTAAEPDSLAAARHNSYPVMAIDVSDGPFSGTIYVAWINVGPPGVNVGVPEAYVIYSRQDVGVSFGSPIKISPATANAQMYLWLACDPVTGHLAAVFEDMRETWGYVRTYVAISTDGAATWTDFPVSDWSFTPIAFRGGAGYTGYRGDYIGVDIHDDVVIAAWNDPRDSRPATFVARVDLAPKEAILTPQPGADLVIGNPVEVTWTSVNSTSPTITPQITIDSVDILFSANGGADFEEIASGLPLLSSYEWTPAAHQHSEDGVLKLVFHNNLTSVVGEETVTGMTVRPAAVYANKSPETQMDFDKHAYTAVAFDYDDGGAGDPDLFLTAETLRGALMEHQFNTLSSDVPRFVDVSADEIAEDPLSLRGVAAADIDNDGDLDLFAAARDDPAVPGRPARLYRNDSPATQPRFTDVGDAIGATTLASLAADSWTGAWGDYNRDGLLDLFIGRGGTDANGEPAGPMADVLLRNLGGAQFQDVTASIGLNAGGNLTTVTGSWSDVDRDGNLDLFVGSRGAEPSKLYMNRIDGDLVQTLVDSPEVLPAETSRLTYVTAASWGDLNNDELLDLVLGRADPGESGPSLLWGTPAGNLHWSAELADGMSGSAQVVFDQDLDGHLDLLLTPYGSATMARLLKNDPEEQGYPAFVDVTAQAGLDDSDGASFAAVVATDFGGPDDVDDGDLDVYLGRPTSTNQFYYQSRDESGADPPLFKKLRVDLRSTDGMNNHFGIGARVTVESPPDPPHAIVQTQIVDGGSGRGAQSPLPLTFGFGPSTDDVRVEVRWPDGFVTSQIVPHPIDAVVIENDHLPGLVQASVAAYPLAKAGELVDWVFEWQTLYNSDHSLDAVYVENWMEPPRNPNCSIAPTTLTPTSYGVVHVVLPKQGGGYVHRMIWSNRTCTPTCNYRYTVTSASGPGSSQTSQPTQFSIPVCID